MRRSLLALVFLFIPVLSLLSLPDLALAGDWQDSLDLSGKFQLQHLYAPDNSSDGNETVQGFRIRRARLKVKAKPAERIGITIQIDPLSSKEHLKDALGSLKVTDKLTLRFGQFKVPVWREELRSSSKLFLVERGEAAGFLKDLKLSGRHIGLEAGLSLGDLSFVFNVSNGAGAGGREDAGREESDFVNSGKLFTGRGRYEATKQLEVGISGAFNQVGAADLFNDNRGNILMVAPDFNLELGTLELEGGMAIGTLDASFLEQTDNQRFLLSELAAIWRTKLPNAKEGLLDSVEVGCGVTRVDPDLSIAEDDLLVLRLGPSVVLNKKVRLQVNGELELPSDPAEENTYAVRSQMAFVF